MTNGKCIYYIEVFSRDGYSIVFCRGDSGGPIYYWNSDWTGIYAAGLVGFIYEQSNDPNCGKAGGISVVSTTVHRIPGPWILS